MHIKDIIEAFITKGTIITRGTMPTPYEQLQRLGGPKVQMRLLRERGDSRGVERKWLMKCTLPALSHENSGLLRLGLESTATRLRRILALSLSGRIMSAELSVVPLDSGLYEVEMTVTQFESASDQSKAQ